VNINLSYPSVNGPEIPFFVAQAKNIWAQYGLNVTAVLQPTSTQFTSLGTGGTDIAIGSAAGLEAAFKGADVKVIADAGPSVSPMIAQQNIKTVKDLKGKTLVSTSPGSTGDTVTKAVMAHFGLNYPQDFTIAYTQGSAAGLISAMAQGSASAVSLEPPLTFDVYAQAPTTHNLFDIATIPALKGLTVDFIAANGTWAKAHKQAVAQFLKAWQAAIVASKKDKTDAITALATGAKITTAQATQWYSQQEPLLAIEAVTSVVFKANVNVLNTAYPGIKDAKQSALVDSSYIKASQA
jgi:ABC-type nitrate/sulfonate/bicarbonate transport system substrate-binding protein